MPIITKFLHFIYPPRCLLCDCVLVADGLCLPCNNSLIRLQADFSSSHLEKIWFDRASSVFAHDGPIVEAVHTYKYKAGFHLLKFFEDEMMLKITSCEYDVVVPIPLHKSRLFKRGYNPSAILANGLSKRISAVCNFNVLKRNVKGIQQVGLAREQRLKNAKGMYSIDEKIKSAIDGKKILLIDDVMTTGATANEAARLLKSAGAQSVDILTIARTI